MIWKTVAQSWKTSFLWEGICSNALNPNHKLKQELTFSQMDFLPKMIQSYPPKETIDHPSSHSSNQSPAARKAPRRTRTEGSENLLRTRVRSSISRGRIVVLRSPFHPKIIPVGWWKKSPQKNHLGMYKTLKIMGKTTNLNWLAGFLPSTVSADLPFPGLAAYSRGSPMHSCLLQHNITPFSTK